MLSLTRLVSCRLSYLIRLSLLIILPFLFQPGSEAGVSPSKAQKQTPVKESSLWYVVSLAGTPVGYAQEEVRPERQKGEPRWMTSQRLLLAVQRLGTRVRMASFSQWEETAQGELRRVEFSLNLSNLETKTKAEVGPTEITVSSGTGGKEFSQKIAYSGRLLGPVGSNLLTMSALRVPGDRVEFATYSPELNLIVHATREAEAWEEMFLSPSSSSIKALRIKETWRELPTRRTIWLTENGQLVQYQEASPLGEIKVTLSSENEAMAAARGQELTELPFTSALVRANVRLPQARLIERIKIRLQHRQPELGFPELPSAYQRVIAKEKAAVVLEIKRPARRTAGWKREEPGFLPDEAELKEYLKANSYLDTEDKLIQQVVKEVTPASADEWRRAINLRDWVSQHLIFDAGIIFAPSVEVIRQRRGTCVSFAVLLATLARAAGIPSRFVMGYVYVNGVWGGHAWVDLFLDGNWYPFDAALPSPEIADACRIALVATSLNRGLGEVVAAGEQLFSRLDIEILEYELEGKTYVAPKKIYEVRGNRYRNFGLGIEVEKPPSFSFDDLDKVWPDNTLLVMKKEGVEVRLSQQAWRPVARLEDYLSTLAGPAFSRAKMETFSYFDQKAYRLGIPEQVVVFWFRGTDLWELRVKGKEGTHWLSEILKNITFN